jgi:hypothetical protein
MKLSTHLVLQALMFALQIGNYALGVVPPKYQPFVMLGVSAIQGFLAWYNHNYTPDGKLIQPK